MYGCETPCPCHRTGLSEDCAWKPTNSGPGALFQYNATNLRRWSDAARALGYDVNADLSLTGVNETMFTSGTDYGRAIADVIADYAVAARARPPP